MTTKPKTPAQNEGQDVTPEREAALKATSAADWPLNKVPEGTVVTLPSGAVARLREPPLRYLLATGRIPPKLWSRLRKDGTAVLVDPLQNLTPEEVRDLINWMIAESFVEPQVSMTRKAGTVYIGDLDERDKDEVMETIGLSLATVSG